MSDATQAAQPTAEPVQEGSRWRWMRPSAEEVGTWFATQPLDAGMEHADFVSGIVVIGASEKVKIPIMRPDGSMGGTKEENQPIFVPYVQINTRLAYFHKLAESRGLIPVVEPAEVPQIKARDSAYYNEHLDDGLWFHVISTDGGGQRRYLCATYRVALYREQDYDRLINGQRMRPIREGRATKQVSGGVDENAVMKAQTGAIGRALGVAGILVVGTGIATAEDMAEQLRTGSEVTASPAGGPPGDATPDPGAAQQSPADPAEALAQMRRRVGELQEQLKTQHAGAWAEFTSWWKERATASGWAKIDDVPTEALRGVIVRMERGLDAAQREAANEPTQVES